MPKLHPENLPLGERVRFGAGRGALIGAVLFSLIWLGLVKRRAGMEQAGENPLWAGGAIILAFAIAGAVLLAFKHTVRTTFGAIKLATICAVPVWFALAPVLTGEFSIPSLVVASIASVATGVIAGLLAWKGGY